MIRECVREAGPVLCLDIGRKQNGMLALPDREPEAWPEWTLSLSADSDVWRQQCLHSGFPEPVTTLLCLEGGPDAEQWAAFWQPYLGSSPISHEGRNFQEGPRAPDAFPDARVVYTSIASLCGMAGRSEIAARTRRQGVVLLHAGEQRTTAWLLFQQRIYGVCEQRTGRSLQAWVEDLREFRFGWLPDEAVRLAGGYGCVFAHPIPDEAESFEPVYVAGPGQHEFSGQGLLLGLSVSDARLRWHGLLHQFASCSVTAS